MITGGCKSGGHCNYINRNHNLSDSLVLNCRLHRADVDHP